METTTTSTKIGTSASAAQPVTVKAAGKRAPARKAVAKAPLKTAAKTAVKSKAAVKLTAPVVAKPPKEKKIKMVRDSVSIPKAEYAVLDDLKVRAGKLGVQVKKTELLRAGIKTLAALSDTAFVSAVRSVPNLKTGRPAKVES